MNGSGNKIRPQLEVFKGKGFTPEGEALRPGYAYLIRSSVRMPELYPLLGELLFASGIKTGSSSQPPLPPPNVIGMFIEDTPDNLMLHLGNPDRYQNESDKRNFTERFGSELARKGTHRAAAWLDTYGRFQDTRGELEDFVVGNKDERWWSQSVAGAGNPMAIMHFFRLVQEKNGTAEVNLFLLNSLSNLYRNLGLSETAAFLKTMLNESIWSVSPTTDSTRVSENYGLFFAVLQENVLKPNEASYLESFFDGIIKVDPCVLDNKFRVARVHIEVLPELVQSHNDFVYIPMWQYDRNNEKFCAGWDKQDLNYICTHRADNCIDPEKPNDEENKKIHG